MRLAVKEHPNAVGRRPTAFYRRLRRNGNVVLLSDRLDSYDVIGRSEIVFTLTGSAALEAIFTGIPAVVFGDVFFASFEGVRRVGSAAEVRAAVRDVLAGRHTGASREAAVACLAAMHDASHRGHVDFSDTPTVTDPENIVAITEGVVRELSAGV